MLSYFLSMTVIFREIQQYLGSNALLLGANMVALVTNSVKFGTNPVIFDKSSNFCDNVVKSSHRYEKSCKIKDNSVICWTKSVIFRNKSSLI